MYLIRYVDTDTMSACLLKMLVPRVMTAEEAFGDDIIMNVEPITGIKARIRSILSGGLVAGWVILIIGDKVSRGCL